MTANLDRDFPVKPFQKVEQLVRGEAAEMPVHEVRHAGLGGAWPFYTSSKRSSRPTTAAAF